MEAMNSEFIALSLLAVCSVPQFFSGVVPSLVDVGNKENDEKEVYWIRRGELLATIFSLGVGMAGSILARSPIPFIGALLMVAIMLYIYEDAIRNKSGAFQQEGDN